MLKIQNSRVANLLPIFNSIQKNCPPNHPLSLNSTCSSWIPNAMVSCIKINFNVWVVSILDQFLNSQVLLQAQLALQDIDSALLSLTKASNIEPNDGKICKELCLVHWKLFSTSARNVDVTNRHIHELSATC